jgi:hypothetical protein
MLLADQAFSIGTVCSQPHLLHCHLPYEVNTKLKLQEEYLFMPNGSETRYSIAKATRFLTRSVLLIFLIHVLTI